MSRKSEIVKSIGVAWIFLFVSTAASRLSAEKADRESAGRKGPVESERIEEPDRAGRCRYTAQTGLTIGPLSIFPDDRVG
jgi:hypothetical protein